MPAYNKITGVHDINGVQIDVVYPPIDFVEKKEMETWRNLNNNSLVLKVSFGGVSFLFPGDIKARAEYELASTVGNKLKSTILLAPHHGSKTSNTEPFLEKVTPRLLSYHRDGKADSDFPTRWF